MGVLKIKMFQTFELTYNDQTVDISKTMGKQLVNLLQVLVYNHGHEATTNTLTETLWPDSDDPKNVLKFSIFRLRKELKAMEPFKDIELIQTTKTGYRLNDELEIESDFRQFEEIWKSLEHVDDFQDQHMKTAKKLIELYKGHIYLTSNPSMWITNICEWYRSSFANCIVKMCNSLMRQNRYEEMLKIDYNAILVEPFYEGLHYYYMKGLIETKDYHKALTYYDSVNEAFYKELGTGLSSRFKELYDIVLNEYENDFTHDLDSIQKEIEANQKTTGGFFCTYDMFKYLYEILIKTAKRDNKRYFLFMIEFHNKELSLDRQMTATKALKESMIASLRSNDIFTRINNMQYIALVNCNEEDNVYIITQRIGTLFYKSFNSKKYRLDYRVKEVTNK